MSLEKFKPSASTADLVTHIATGLVTEIQTLGHQNAPFEIKPETVIPREVLQKYGFQALTSDSHLAAKYAMESSYSTDHDLSIWYEEMPGKLILGLDGVNRYDGTSPLFFVQNGIRMNTHPKSFSK